MNDGRCTDFADCFAQEGGLFSGALDQVDAGARNIREDARKDYTWETAAGSEIEPNRGL